MPRAIVSDRDSRFTGHFWRTLMKLMGTQLNLSTAFHPQSDGQTERANRTLEEMLRSYVSYKQNDWDLFLPSLEFAYNNSVNPSTGFSPFFLNYGHDPLVPAALVRPTTSSSVPAVTEFVTAQATALAQAQNTVTATRRARRHQVGPEDSPLFLTSEVRDFSTSQDSILAQAQDTITEAQDKQKAQADRSRRPATFEVGDKVLLSTEHISVAAHNNRPSRKLEPKAIGPFPIVAKHHDNAFELALPPHMKQYPVFNADRLRLYVESPPEFDHRTPPKPPPDIVDGTEEWEVEKVVDYKMFGRTPKWLVKWKGYSDDDSTWEPRRNLTNAKDIIAEFEANRRALEEGKA